MAADTSPDAVRTKLDVSSSELPDSDIPVAAAEAFVDERLLGHLENETLLDEIATYVAADMAFPIVSGSAHGKEVQSVEQGEESITYTNSAQSQSFGQSTHWVKATRLDYTGRLEGDNVSGGFEVM